MHIPRPMLIGGIGALAVGGGAAAAWKLTHHEPHHVPEDGGYVGPPPDTTQAPSPAPSGDEPTATGPDTHHPTDPTAAGSAGTGAGQAAPIPRDPPTTQVHPLPSPVRPPAPYLSRADWLDLQPGPVGTAVRGGHVVHVVQPGETMSSIARSYSQAYHLFLGWNDVQAVNHLPDPGHVVPGQVLALPAQIDAIVDQRRNDFPGLVRVDGHYRHQVQPGDTLTNIASRYDDMFGTHATPASIAAANPGVIRNVDAISPAMPPLVIPGLDPEPAAAAAPTIGSFAGREVATRVAKLRYEDGHTGTAPVIHFTADVTAARRIGTLADARRAAHDTTVQTHVSTSVLQARDGWYVVPLQGHEDAGLDDSTQTLSLSIAAASPWTREMVEYRPGQGVVDHAFAQQR